MDFRLARSARRQYGFDESLFSTTGDVVLADPGASRRFAARMVLAGGSRPERPVHAGDIDAIALIHEVMHHAVAASGRVRGDRFPVDAAAGSKLDPESDTTGATLVRFEDAFPSVDVYAGMDPAAWLAGTSDGIPNRDVDLEELLLLWVANQNPAFMVYGELYDDDALEGSEYPQLIARIREHSTQRAQADVRGEDLVEKLLAPGRAAPGSLSEQLRWILDHWPEVVGDDLRARLTLSLDILAEEEHAGKLAWERAAGGGAPSFDASALRDVLHDEETQHFSPDREWMPSVVLIAKSTYVWLDQLSRRYGRQIWTLDAIPDEELDALAQMGVTGLWLIGLWERSHASQRIKQLRGNDDAVASAYSLMDYRIAEDLGGERAYEHLRDRAWARRIRLASDMVPNHMGIDSRWVMDHPDWFLSRPDSPYPSYGFGGPNLSNDERVGIYLEDHYFDSTDASVVFRRQDRWSGQEQFVYHGNDGTSFPWNDTAQLDYLNAEAREAVIQTILAVARRFPIIRFDAAMTLARRHVQRLWYPLPGHGGAIPSRAEYAMTQEQFDAAMPNEFWREVVDRVALEVPDTLLLAEAFWMLEGYFVRTLGMHRVYNSAFMHMLRDEKNEEYHGVIRETLEFDPEILKRYVNFMNNPDEATALEQFGDGDKYFGVATMLATLPGLPMLGHGQIEGFREKYGMEFRRATLHEEPNAGLIARHEREIFPLLRQRWRFAEAKDFRLHAFDTGSSDDQDVFAYSNGWGDSRSLVAYHNRFGTTHGFVSDVAERFGVRDDRDQWLILRDHRSGLEFLRNAHDLHSRGLELELNAYQSHVFLAFQLVVDGADREWSRLAWRIGLAGVPDLQAELADQRMQPLIDASSRYLDAEALRRLAGAALNPEDSRSEAQRDALVVDLTSRLTELAALLESSDEETLDAARRRLDERTRALVDAVRLGRAGSSDATTPHDDTHRSLARLARFLGTSRRAWGIVGAWALADAAVALDSADGSDRGRTFDALGLARATATAGGAIGLDDRGAGDLVAAVRALLTLSPLECDESGRLPKGWTSDTRFRAATGWNEFEGVEYVGKEAIEALLGALAARDTVSGVSDAFDDAAAIRDAVARNGYRVSTDAREQAAARPSPIAEVAEA